MTTDGDQPGELPNYGSVPPPPPGGYAAYVPAPRQNEMALWSMILGIAGTVLSLCCFFGGVLGIPAIVLGIVGRSEITRSHGTQSGGGMAIAGIVTGLIALLVGMAMIIVSIVGGFSGDFSVG